MLDRKVKQARKEALEYQDAMEQKVNVEKKDKQGMLDRKVKQARKEALEYQDTMEQKVNVEKKDNQGVMERKVSQDKEETKVVKVTKESKGKREHQDHKDLKEQREKKVLQRNLLDKQLYQHLLLLQKQRFLRVPVTREKSLQQLETLQNKAYSIFPHLL